VLFSERRRRAAQAEAEASGASFWTEKLGPEVRGKLATAWLVAAAGYFQNELEMSVQVLVSQSTGNLRPAPVVGAIMALDTAEVMDYLEAINRSLRRLGWQAQVTFQDTVNDALNAHRIKFKMIDGEIVPLDSEVLHVEVVEPALRLLHGNAQLAGAHESFMKALKEISNSDAPDAITDAGTALQETLVALGCHGNALGPLINDAVKRHLLSPHDAALEKAISGFLHWASANRSESGEGHHVSTATLSDAWLMVHIVGALIVRLADPRRRA
jgi:hypothetical protein